MEKAIDSPGKMKKPYLEKVKVPWFSEQAEKDWTCHTVKMTNDIYDYHT